MKEQQSRLRISSDRLSMPEQELGRQLPLQAGQLGCMHELHSIPRAQLYKSANALRLHQSSCHSD